MYLIGGWSNSGYEKDVGIFANGRIWTQEMSSAIFNAREAHQLLTFQDKTYLIGGWSNSGYEKDVGIFANGRTWTQEMSSAIFNARNTHQVVVFQDKMYLIGGRDIDRDSNKIDNNDLRVSTDGKVWTEISIN